MAENREPPRLSTTSWWIQNIYAERPAWKCLLVSTLSTTGTMLLISLLGSSYGPANELYPLVLANILFLTIYSGSVIGVSFSVVNALVFDYFFTPPIGMLLQVFTDYPHYVIFIGCSLLLSVLVSLLGREYRRSEEAEVAKEEVLRFVAHDLRNPLSAILMSCHSLRLLLTRRNAVIEPDVGLTIETINCSAYQMSRLVGDLLQSAKFELGRFPVEAAPIAATELLKAATGVFEPLMKQQNLSLIVDIDESTPPVLCDRDRILQVLSNLLGNAIKFTPPGGEIRLRVEPRGGMVAFSVADNGCGISEERLPRLFERFGTTKKASKQGLGLGLYIARQIVVSHGGQIEVSSKAGVGTTFTFTIPRVAAARRARAA